MDVEVRQHDYFDDVYRDVGVVFENPNREVTRASSNGHAVFKGEDNVNLKKMADLAAFKANHCH